MKALNTVLSIILLIAVAFLFWKVYDTPVKEKGKPASSEEVAERLKNQDFAAAHIAFINTDSLVAKYDYHKELKVKLEEKAKRLEADLANKSQVFQENLAIFQQQAESMSPEKLQANQMDLERTRDGLLRYRDEQANQLAIEEQAMNQQIKEDMESVLNNIREEYQLDYILSFDPNSILLSTNNNYDITPLVADRLNEKYRAGKEDKSETSDDNK